MYDHVMAKDVIQVSEAEAMRDFASLMARVRSGTEVVIEDHARPVAVVPARCGALRSSALGIPSPRARAWLNRDARWRLRA